MDRIVAMAAICAACIALGAPMATALSANEEGFKDDFSTLERDRWFVSSGWANGDHQNCLWHDSRVEIADGIQLLSLSDAAQGDRAYSCAEIQSEAKFGYGLYEARMKVPFASGVNANFFTHIGAPQGLPHNEIDFEFITGPQRGQVLQTNFYTGDEGGNEAFHPVPGADTAFRTYAFQWAPDALRWYVDGALIREETEVGIPAPPQKMYLSVWSTDSLTEWMGPLVYPGKPLVLEVDWVAFTPAKADCRSVACAD